MVEIKLTLLLTYQLLEHKWFGQQKKVKLFFLGFNLTSSGIVDSNSGAMDPESILKYRGNVKIHAG